jgi:hypothetical protein
MRTKVDVIQDAHSGPVLAEAVEKLFPDPAGATMIRPANCTSNNDSRA